MIGNAFWRSAERGRLVSLTLATCGIIGVGFFAASVLLLHLLQTELDLRHHFISEYANGQAGWLMVAAFIVFGFGVLAIAGGMYQLFESGWRATLAFVMIGLLGVGSIAAGIFPIDVRTDDGDVTYTLTGQIHGLAVTVGVIGLVIGTFLLRDVFARTPQWEEIARLTRWFASAILIGLILWIVAGEIEFFSGLIQRTWFVVMLTWIALLGVQLRRTSISSRPSAS